MYETELVFDYAKEPRRDILLHRLQILLCERGMDPLTEKNPAPKGTGL